MIDTYMPNETLQLNVPSGNWIPPNFPTRKLFILWYSRDTTACQTQQHRGRRYGLRCFPLLLLIDLLGCTSPLHPVSPGSFSTFSVSTPCLNPALGIITKSSSELPSESSPLSNTCTKWKLDTPKLSNKETLYPLVFTWHYSLSNTTTPRQAVWVTMFPFVTPNRSSRMH